MEQLVDKFKDLDLFGQGVNLTVKGKDTYRTCFGALLALQIYLTVFLYGFNKYDLLINRQDTSHQSIINANEFKATDPFSLKEIEANFAISLWSNLFVPTQLSV